jgi:uncharacterized protein YdeI (YjbR/CyaY-like superfamily)
MQTAETEYRFSSSEKFCRWLTLHEDDSPGIWVAVGRKGSTLPLLSYSEALLVALAHGWIDSLARRINDESFLQRFTPRRPNSAWSQRNRDRVAAMQANGSLSPRGLAEMQRARLDGRWCEPVEPRVPNAEGRSSRVSGGT